MLPVVLATLGLVALGVAQTNAAVRAALEAQRGQSVATTALAALRLENLIEQEIAEGDRVRARSGQASALLTAATQQTDQAVTDFRRVAEDNRRLSPSLSGVLDVAEAQLGTLGTLREQVAKLDADESGSETYDDVRHAVLGFADALPSTLTDPGLAATARAVAAIARAEHYGSEQRELLHVVLTRRAFAPGEQSELDRLVGAQDERLAEFNRNATADQRAIYANDFVGPDVNTALTIRTAALQPDAGPAGALKVDPDVWYIAQSNLIRRMHEVQINLSHTLDQTSRDREASAVNQAIFTAAATIVVILLAFGAAVFFAVHTARRLRRLRRAALRVAGFELPDAIAELTDATDLDGIRQVLKASGARANALSVAGGDEIGEVGAALSTLHRQALRMAAEQASLRQDVAGMFIALSRRGQTLIARQLQLIAEFEDLETDQATLQRLFTLGHLATRMRRNEENLLVLAGGDVGVRVLGPAALIDVIRTAAAEIEDYHRVDTVGVAEVAIAAHVVRDVVQLLSELLENATAFAPPHTRVRVSARRAVDNVTVTVFDDGIGMPPERVTELNTRLANPTRLTAELAGTMGLLVVARLAARHGIGVELRSSPGGGTAALVAIPMSILVPMPAPVAPVSPAGPPLPVWVAPPDPAVPVGPAMPVGPAAALGTVVPLGVAPPVPAEATANGSNHPPADMVLPRRRPGDMLLSGRAVAPGDLYGLDDPSRPPDPETTRVRLGGLASGLAAAARLTQPPA
jgi:signal transduction histidine kinase